MLTAGSWLLPQIIHVSPKVAEAAAKWEDRFLAAFVALMFVVVATWITRSVKVRQRSRMTAAASNAQTTQTKIDLPKKQIPPETQEALTAIAAFGGARSAGNEMSVAIPVNIADWATITDERPADTKPPKTAESSGQPLKEDIVADALNDLAIRKAVREAQTVQPSPTSDAELAAKYFNEFSPAPARRTTDYDITYWIKLGTLFGVQNKYLRLRFLPDTNCKNEDALLLLLFGYRQIYDRKKVEARTLEQGLHFSNCRKQLPPQTATARLNEMLTGEARDDRVSVDELAKSWILKGRVSEKFGLASGGFYAITDEGVAETEKLFEDLVRRA